VLQTEFVQAETATEPRLMIVLHGLGDSMEGYRWLPQAMQFPWLSYLLVNAPDPYYTGFAWYPMDIDPGPAIERSRKLLFELLDQAIGGSFAAEKTIVFGFSQGCLMAIEVGARYPHRLAGILGVSGYVHEPDRLLRELSPQARQQRFLITHGTQDPLIPIDLVRPQIDLLRKAGLKIDWREYAKAHTIDGDSELSALRGFVNDSYV
jgi:phospholipase/carboxylesterase